MSDTIPRIYEENSPLNPDISSPLIENLVVSDEEYTDSSSEDFTTEDETDLNSDDWETVKE